MSELFSAMPNIGGSSTSVVSDPAIMSAMAKGPKKSSPLKGLAKSGLMTGRLGGPNSALLTALSKRRESKKKTSPERRQSMANPEYGE